MLSMWGPANLHSFFFCLFFKCDLKKKKKSFCWTETMCAKLYVFFLFVNALNINSA